MSLQNLHLHPSSNLNIWLYLDFLRFLDILKICKSSQTFKCYVTVLLTTGWMRLKAIFCAVASFSSHIHANLCKLAFFSMDVIFPPADPDSRFLCFLFKTNTFLFTSISSVATLQARLFSCLANKFRQSASDASNSRLIRHTNMIS